MKINDPEVLRNRFFARFLVAHPENLPLQFLELAIQGALLPGIDKTTYTMLRSVTTIRGWRRKLMLREEMAKLPIPILFLWGESDKFAPPSSGQDLVKRMPDAKIEIISDAGHIAYLDQPEIIADRINNFLRKPV
jgi:pimeloyl-ACP methyl ester carboxylesterase